MRDGWGMGQLTNDFRRSCRDNDDEDTVLHLLGICLALCLRRKRYIYASYFAFHELSGTDCIVSVEAPVGCYENGHHNGFNLAFVCPYMYATASMATSTFMKKKTITNLLKPGKRSPNVFVSMYILPIIVTVGVWLTIVFKWNSSYVWMVFLYHSKGQ